jgi:hypothetical protein
MTTLGWADDEDVTELTPVPVITTPACPKASPCHASGDMKQAIKNVANRVDLEMKECCRM